MQQRDILLDEIQQFSRVLAKLMFGFLDLKAKGDITLAIQTTNQQLKSELDIDIDALINFTEEELENYAEEKQLTDNHLDELAKYLYELGEIEQKKNNLHKARKYFEAAKKLIETTDKISKTYVFERATFKQEINEILTALRV